MMTFYGNPCTEGWFDVLDPLEKEKGIAILLGATDTREKHACKIPHFSSLPKGFKGCPR
jgi:hypothetical protein